MKRLLIILSISFTCLQAFTQNKLNTSSPEIEFRSNNVALGLLSKGIVSEKKIQFQNTGDQPLLISKIKTSCGCTASNWPKEPILPGKSNYITIRYNTSKVGKFRKSLTVVSNAKTSNVILYVSGEVRVLTDEANNSNSTAKIILKE